MEGERRALTFAVFLDELFAELLAELFDDAVGFRLLAVFLLDVFFFVAVFFFVLRLAEESEREGALLVTFLADFFVAFPAFFFVDFLATKGRSLPLLTGYDGFKPLLDRKRHELDARRTRSWL